MTGETAGFRISKNRKIIYGYKATFVAKYEKTIANKTGENGQDRVF